jgi:hypothetical protein
MKIREYLKEERMSSKDKRFFLKIIDKIPNVKKGKYVIKSFDKDYDNEERNIEYRPIKNGIEFSYNADFFELTNTLVDIVDLEPNLEFKVSTEKPTNTTYFKITTLK